MSYTPSGYPTNAGSNAIAGKKFLLYVKYNNVWNLLGGSRDISLDISAESIDASCADDDSWGDNLPGSRNWSASGSLVVKTTNVGDGIIENWVLDDTLQAQKPALLFALVNTSDNTYYEGWGTVSSYSVSGSYKDVMTKSISIAGAGKVALKSNFVAGNSISPLTATFSKASPADKTFTITTTDTSSVVTVTGVRNNGVSLTSTTDYTYSAGTLTITDDYLGGLTNGDVVLDVIMNYGNNLKVTITVGA